MNFIQGMYHTYKQWQSHGTVRQRVVRQYKKAEKYCKITWHRLRTLENTNLNLALFHLHHGNINDAIMRLKMLLLMRSKIPVLHYYLMQCYELLYKNKLALKHLEKYTATGDQSFAKELIYYKKLLTEHSADYIPTSVIKIYADVIASSKNRLIAKNQEMQHLLFDAMQDYLKAHYILFQYKIIEIGCGNGGVGVLIKNSALQAHITALEISSNMLKVAWSRTLKEQKVYDAKFNKTLNAFIKNIATQKHMKYDIVLISEQLKMDPRCLKKIAMLQKICHNQTFIGVIFQCCYEDNIMFSCKSREFLYNPEYIKHCFEEAGWKVAVSNTKNVEKYSICTMIFANSSQV